jgi:hypothetical protein
MSEPQFGRDCVIRCRHAAILTMKQTRCRQRLNVFMNAFVVATQAQDPDAVVARFTRDAVVRDEGRDRRGAAEVRSWAEEDF